MVIVARAVTFAEENFHALRHVDTHEVVEPSDHRSDSGKCDRLRDSMVAEVALAEGGNLEVKLDNKRAVEPLPCNMSKIPSDRFGATSPQRYRE